VANYEMSQYVPFFILLSHSLYSKQVYSSAPYNRVPPSLMFFLHETETPCFTPMRKQRYKLRTLLHIWIFLFSENTRHTHPSDLTVSSAIINKVG